MAKTHINGQLKNLIELNRSQLHLNPSLPYSLKETIKSLVANPLREEKSERNFNGEKEAKSEEGPLVWVLSSGTSSFHHDQYKLIALTHKAFISSAEAVNKHLQVSKQDIWINILPHFHVGGLGIFYRALISSTEVCNLWSPEVKWNPQVFVQACKEAQATLTSLVPTQVYDLVRENLLAPPSLRAVVVGGAHLNQALYDKARDLGWPLLPSYGMTEACSQIATASLESLKSRSSAPPLQILEHVQVKQIESSSQLMIKGPSLLNGFYLILNGKSQEWCHPLDSEGWFLTQDCAQIERPFISLSLRVDDIVKIKGEMVNLSTLRHRLDQLCLKLDLHIDCTICGVPDDRDGHKLTLIGEASSESLHQLFIAFNELVLPFEKLSRYIDSVEIPRNSLGKILQNQLAESIRSRV